ncbi:MAG: hypothetical protein H6727_10655 [Myxococcales bacterium]|nr:hypothetical protein [Myxococcales bacterium]
MLEENKISSSPKSYLSRYMACAMTCGLLFAWGPKAQATPLTGAEQIQAIKDPQIRARTVKQLTLPQNDTSRDLLLHLLQDPSFDVRFEALQHLAGYPVAHHEAIIKGIEASLKMRSRNKAYPIAAVEVLARYGAASAKALPTLLRVRARSKMYRTQMAWFLRKLAKSSPQSITQHPDALGRLARYLGDRNAATRRNALEALESLPPDASLQQNLLRLFLTGNDNTSQKAAKLLQRKAGQQADLVEKLRLFLGHDKASIRERTRKLLIALVGPKAATFQAPSALASYEIPQVPTPPEADVNKVRQLVLLALEKDPARQKEGDTALLTMGNKALPALIALLRDPQKELRKAVIQRIGGLGPQAKIAVGEMLWSSTTPPKGVSWFQRRKFDKLLGLNIAKLGPEVIPALLAAVVLDKGAIRRRYHKDPSRRDDLQKTAIIALLALGKPAFEPLRQGLYSVRQKERSGILGVFAKMEVPQLKTFFPDLQKSLDSVSLIAPPYQLWQLQSSYSQVFARLEDFSAPLMLQCFLGSDRFKRQLAHNVLFRLGRKAGKIAPDLAPLLQEAGPLRGQAITLLARLETKVPAAVPVLAALLKDSPAHSSGNISLALVTCGGESPQHIALILHSIEESLKGKHIYNVFNHLRALEKSNSSAPEIFIVIDKVIRHPGFGSLQMQPILKLLKKHKSKAASLLPALFDVALKRDNISKYTKRNIIHSAAELGPKGLQMAMPYLIEDLDSRNYFPNKNALRILLNNPAPISAKLVTKLFELYKIKNYNSILKDIHQLLGIHALQHAEIIRRNADSSDKRLVIAALYAMLYGKNALHFLPSIKLICKNLGLEKDYKTRRAVRDAILAIAKLGPKASSLSSTLACLAEQVYYRKLANAALQQVLPPQQDKPSSAPTAPKETTPKSPAPPQPRH